MGHQSGPGDTILLRIETVTPNRVAGSLQVLISGKDSRVGRFSGTEGADGVLRVAFSYMQEGLQDSIALQLKGAGTASEDLLLRPSAYDPQSGREYPDSTKDFTIRLKPVSCERKAI